MNLAISDLFLCTIVSPLTLIELLYKRWTGPKAPWLCCLSGMGPACITFVSTLTITGIAIDRWDIFWPIWLLISLIACEVGMWCSQFCEKVPIDSMNVKSNWKLATLRFNGNTQKWVLTTTMSVLFEKTFFHKWLFDNSFLKG